MNQKVPLLACQILLLVILNTSAETEHITYPVNHSEPSVSQSIPHEWTYKFALNIVEHKSTTIILAFSKNDFISINLSLTPITMKK